MFAFVVSGRMFFFSSFFHFFDYSYGRLGPLDGCVPLLGSGWGQLG
jgi:hypothetical protein